MWLNFNKDYIKFEKPACDKCGKTACGQFVKNRNSILTLCKECKEQNKEDKL